MVPAFYHSNLAGRHITRAAKTQMADGIHGAHSGLKLMLFWSPTNGHTAEEAGDALTVNIRHYNITSTIKVELSTKPSKFFIPSRRRIEIPKIR